MAMPKKGTRKIQVNNKVYRWRVRGTHYGPDRATGHILTIENPNGEIKTIGYERMSSITPSDVREAILETSF